MALPPTRLRYVDRTVGLFVVLAAAVLVAAVVLAPQTRRWFTPVRRLVVRLPREGSLGLRPGADVLILGSVVGSVDDIVVTDAGSVEADVSIHGNFLWFVRVDSRAVIRKPLGIGDTVIEISRGEGEPLTADHEVILATADKAPVELVEETLRDLRGEALPAIHDLRTAIATYTALATDLRARQEQVGRSLDRLDQLADRAVGGQGLAGVVLNDPHLAADVRESVARLRASAAAFDRLLADARAAVRTATASGNQVPALVLQAQMTLRQVQRLSEVMQRSWLLSGNGGGHPDDGGGRLGAEDAGAGR